MSSPSVPPPADRLRAELERAFPHGRIVIRDQSARHHRHAEAHDGGHLWARVVSPAFEGLPPLARHRLLYRRIAPLEALGVHALALRLVTPDEDNPFSRPSPSTEDRP